MQRPEFLALFDEVLDLPAGSLTGKEHLENLENWNSLAVISLIALADEHCGVLIPNKQLLACKTVDDIVRLVGVPN